MKQALGIMALQRKRGRERNRHKHADRERTNPLPISPSIFMPVEPAGARAFRVWEMTLKLNKYLSLSWAVLNTSNLMSSFYTHNSSVLTHVRVSHPISGTPTHFGLPKLFARKPHHHQQQQQLPPETACLTTLVAPSLWGGGERELKELCCWKASVKKRKTGPKMSQSALILPGDRWINGRSMNKHVRTRHTVCVCVCARTGAGLFHSQVGAGICCWAEQGWTRGRPHPLWLRASGARGQTWAHPFWMSSFRPHAKERKENKNKQNKKRGKQQNPTLFQRKK